MPVEEIVVAAVAFGIKATEKYFDRASKHDSDVVGIGLAVGYFYNFLDPVSTLIESDQFVFLPRRTTRSGGNLRRTTSGCRSLFPTGST